jgi:hypothetical protein
MKPEKVFRIGSVTASVFVNEIETDAGKRRIRSVALQRRYRDDDGEWKSSNSFGLGELPQALTAIDLALKFVANKEAAVGE